MKTKSDSMEWIPLWVDKWIFGTTRIELEPDERSVWVDMMALAAKDHGFIRANVGIPYPPQQLSGLLCITEELLARTIQKCLAVGKLAECKDSGGYYLPNWGEYQLSERHKRRFKEKIEDVFNMSAKTDTMAKNKDCIGEDINNIKKRIGVDVLFEKFWKFYPARNGRKLTKKQTKEFFEKYFKSEVEINFLLQATENYAAQSDGIHVKDPIRFLRNDYWKGWIEKPQDKKTW